MIKRPILKNDGWKCPECGTKNKNSQVKDIPNLMPELHFNCSNCGYHGTARFFILYGEAEREKDSVY